MIGIESHAEGAVLPVRAQAGARSTGIRGAQQGSLRVAVTQVPEKGKANKAILEVLARQLGVRRSQIALISGETSPQKKFLVAGMTVEELSQRVSALLSGRS